MPSFRIRDAADGDAASIAALISELGYPTTEPEMRERLCAIQAESNFRTLVAESAATVIGIAGICIAPFYERNGLYGRLLVLAVADGHRNGGVGRALIGAAEAWLAERGATAIVVGTAHHRQRAHRFYERAGYRSTGLRYVKELGSGC